MEHQSVFGHYLGERYLFWQPQVKSNFFHRYLQKQASNNKDVASDNDPIKSDNPNRKIEAVVNGICIVQIRHLCKIFRSFMGITSAAMF
jgi:hypothetical protein